MATHSSVLAWRIPGTGELGGLPSMGSHRVRHDWSDLAAAAAAASHLGALVMLVPSACSFFFSGCPNHSPPSSWNLYSTIASVRLAGLLCLNNELFPSASDPWLFRYSHSHTQHTHDVLKQCIIFLSITCIIILCHPSKCKLCEGRDLICFLIYP